MKVQASCRFGKSNKDNIFYSNLNNGRQFIQIFDIKSEISDVSVGVTWGRKSISDIVPNIC